MTELFPIPDSWVWTTLGEIAETSLGKMLDRGKSSGGHLVPYLRNVNVQWGHIDLDDVLTMDIPPDQQERFRLQAGDLLACEGGYIGRCAIWPGGTEYMAFQKALHRVRPLGGIDSRFIRYLLESLSINGQLLPFVTGSTIKHLPQERLRQVPVPLAPHAEQERIITALEDHLSRLDAGGMLVSSTLTRSARLRRAILDAAALGRLNRREQAPEATEWTIPASRLNGHFDYRKLCPLPEGWGWYPAEEVCEVIACGGTPRADLMHAQSGDIPFLKVYNLTQHGHVDFTVRPTFIDMKTHRGLLRRSRVLPGDVLTNIVGPPLGKTAIVPDSYPEWNINQAIVAFRAGRIVTRNWLAIVLQAPTILTRLQATAKATAGQFNIALSTCRALPIPVPPTVEQEHITENVQQLLLAIAVAENGAKVCRTREARLRQALLTEAFAGNLVPQHSADEPASALLDRIRSERSARPQTLSRRKSSRHVPQGETLL